MTLAQKTVHRTYLRMSRNGDSFPNATKALPEYLQLVMVWLITELNGVEISAEPISQALRKLGDKLEQDLKNLKLEYPNPVYDKRDSLENAVKKAEKKFNKVSADLDKRTKEGADPRHIEALSVRVASAESVLKTATTALETMNAKYNAYFQWSYARDEVKKYTLAKWIAALKK